MRIGLVRRTVAVLLVLAACDASVTPPVESPSIALSLRDVQLFSTAGSVTPDTAAVTISNNGVGSLAGLTLHGPVYVDGTSGWLSAELQDTTLSLFATAADLSVGTYTASVDVLASSAPNSPRSIAVTFHVGESELIDLSEDSLTFTATEGGVLPPGQTVSVSNGGDGVLRELEHTVEYPTGSEQDWLATTLGSTTAPTSVQLAPQRILPPGTHEAVLRVRSPLSIPEADSVHVAFVVAPRPTVLISANEIAIAAAEGSSVPISSQVTVDEKNRRTLTVSVQPDAPWLSTAADTIVTPAELDLIADPTGLAVGTHHGLVIVSSGGADADTVVVNLEIRTMPTVEVSIAEVAFTAYRTGPTPEPQVVRIENAGAYPLSGLTLNVVPASDWLSAALDRSYAPAALTLQVDPAQITPGTTTADVIVTGSDAKPDTTAVSFTLLSGPRLSISSDGVIFRADSGQGLPLVHSVGIANDGEGSLIGLAVSGVPAWLNASLTGSLAPAELVLRPNTTVLIPGTYRTDVSVSSSVADNSPQTVAVVYEIRTPDPPQIRLSPDSVRFVSDSVHAVEQQISMQNVGGPGLVVGTVTSPSWLAVEPLPATNPTVLRLTTRAAGLVVGTYTGVVVVNSNSPSSPDAIPVVLTLQPSPVIALSADSVKFRTIRGADPPFPNDDPQTILVFNESAGVAGELEMLSGSSWLDLTGLNSGRAPDSMHVTLDPPNAAGIDVDTVEVRSATAGIAPASLVVVHERLPSLPGGGDASPAVSPARVRFVAAERNPIGDQVVRIDNEGGGPLVGLSITSAPAWISADLGATTAPARLTLTPDITGLVPGSPYGGDVVIGSSAGDIVLPVDLTLLNGPALALSADTLRFFSGVGQAAPRAQAINVANEQGGVLTGLDVTGAPTWLRATLGSDTGPTMLTVSVDGSGLAAGTFAATLQVASPVASNSPREVTVVLDIVPSAVIALSADSVHFVGVPFDPPPADRSVLIDNDGSGDLTGLRLASVPSWLSASLDGKTSPAVLTLTPNLGAAPTGTSTGAILISSDVAAAVSLPVVLTKRTGPQIAATASEVVFRVFHGQAIQAPQVVMVSNGAGGMLRDVYVSASSVPKWLRVSPTSPSGVPTPLVLETTTTGSDPGSYTGTLLIRSSVASNSPVGLDVRLEVDPGPTILASPVGITMTGISGSAIPDTQYVVVSNSGRGDLGSILATTNASWLSATVDSSVTPTRLIVTADPSAVGVGSRDGEVTVRSVNAGNAVSVPIVFDVVPPPEIGLSPSALVFHSTVGDTELPDPQAVTVFDATGRSLGEITVASESWLSTSVDLTTVPATIVVQPNAVLDVLESPYTATISARSSVATNSPQPLPVVYYIDLGGRPVIRLSRDSLTFGRVNPPAQTVSISNGGGGTLRDLRVVDLTASDWLFVLLDSRVAPARLTVAVVPGKVSGAPPNSVATLQVSGAEAEPRILTVLLP